MKISIFLIKFLFIGALFIVSNHELFLKDPVDRQEFFDLFYSWLSNLFDQAMQISGYVIDSEWLPESMAPPTDT